MSCTQLRSINGAFSRIGAFAPMSSVAPACTSIAPVDSICTFRLDAHGAARRAQLDVLLRVDADAALAQVDDELRAVVRVTDGDPAACLLVVAQAHEVAALGADLDVLVVLHVAELDRARSSNAARSTRGPARRRTPPMAAARSDRAAMVLPSSLVRAARPCRSQRAQYVRKAHVAVREDDENLVADVGQAAQPELVAGHRRGDRAHALSTPSPQNGNSSLTRPSFFGSWLLVTLATTT